MQKEFEYLACDEELTSKHVGGKKENQAGDRKQKFKHVIRK